MEGLLASCYLIGFFQKDQDAILLNNYLFIPYSPILTNNIADYSKLSNKV